MVGITVLPLGEGKSEPTYLYEDPTHNDSTIKLRGFFIEQHGKRIHSFFSPCRDLDRLCITPQIGDKSNQKMAELFSARKISWQRTLDTIRVDSLKKWWESRSSLSTNGSIVWLPEGFRPTIDNQAKTSHIEIDPSTWTVSICTKRGCGWTPAQIDPNYTDWQFDCCPECGKCFRPGKLVDGQHRVRGMSQAANPHNLEPIICTVLCEDDNFTSQLTAKIFTEITSKAEGLDSLHAEFLMAKYNIKPKYSTGTNAGRNRKKAYEVVVSLNESGTRWASVVRSPYRGRVKMIKPTGSRNDVIEADRLALKNIYSWISTNIKTKGGEIKPLEGDSVTTIVEYLEYFLDAVLDVWGPGAHGTNDFWDESRGSKKAGQRKGVFRMMMHLFGIITARVKLRNDTPTKDIYISELEHIQNIAWTNLNTWGGVYTKQDTEQGVVRKVLSHIYLHAPSPLGRTAKIPPSVNSWMNAQPDPFNLTFDGLSIAGGELKIKSRSESKISDPLHATPVSTGAGPINASSGCTITIKHGGTTIYEETKGSHNHIVNYTDLKKIPIGGGAPVAVVAGDNLDVTVSYKNGWSNTPRVETKTITITA